MHFFKIGRHGELHLTTLKNISGAIAIKISQESEGGGAPAARSEAPLARVVTVPRHSPQHLTRNFA